MKSKLYILLGIMVSILLIGSVIIRMTKKDIEADITKTEDRLQVVTTFYPVYMIGANLAKGIEGIEVNSLTDLNTGCLHDYQLTTEDMKLISEADVMIINGGGMESFLEDIKTNYPNLSIIDASEGIEMLPSGEDHEDDATAEIATLENTTTENTTAENATAENATAGTSTEENAEESTEKTLDEDQAAEEEHDHGEWNAHVWLDPELYILQINQVSKGLEDYIRVNKSSDLSMIEQLNSNRTGYIDEITKLDQQIRALADEFKKNSEANRDAVIFHDAFAYLAGRVGINVAHTVPLDSDTSLSAGDIGAIIDEVEEGNIRYLFTEEQYSDSIASQIAAETEATVYIIDSAVTGDGSIDSYLVSMQKNIDTLKKLVK